MLNWEVVVRVLHGLANGGDESLQEGLHAAHDGCSVVGAATGGVPEQLPCGYGVGACWSTEARGGGRLTHEIL